MDFILIIVGLLFLVKGGNWLLKSSVGLSLNLSIPKAVIGMTVVSLATSTPELIVSIQSALQGHPDIALGNTIGSNIANLAFVLGVTVIIAPIEVSKSFFKKDWPMMMLSTVLLIVMIVFDGILSFFEGIILFSMMVAFIIYLLKGKKIKEEVTEGAEDFKVLSNFKILGYFLIGGLALWLGSETLIEGAVSLAEHMGVDERVISISIISVGTSIPELSASIIAAIKKEKAISLGNLIGSNIFNILFVLGITSIIHPIEIKEVSLFLGDLTWMFFISVLIFLLVITSRTQRINRYKGVFLLVLYSYFIYSVILKKILSL